MKSPGSIAVTGGGGGDSRLGQAQRMTIVGYREEGATCMSWRGSEETDLATLSSWPPSFPDLKKQITLRIALGKMNPDAFPGPVQQWVLS